VPPIIKGVSWYIPGLSSGLRATRASSGEVQRQATRRRETFSAVI